MDLRAVIFMPALAGSVIFGFVFLLFASHYYLTVLESTGAGAREITWVSEPAIDHFWKFWYMLWLFGLWFGPAYLIGRALSAGTESVWLRLAIPIAVVWLCYPISQLSSLSASTIWLPLTADVFARLIQKPGVTLGYYLLSIPVLALFGLAFKWAFLTAGDWYLLFVGVPLMVVAGLVYARLIGRLAYALRFTRSIFREARKKKRPATFAESTTRPEGAPEPTFRHAGDLPPISTVEGDLTGYDFQLDDEPSPRKRVTADVIEIVDDAAESQLPGRALADDEVVAAYGVHKPEVEPTKSTPMELVEPKAEELRLLSREGAPKKPKRVWSPDLLDFLAQAGTISVIFTASGLCFLVGVMVRIARDFNPAAD